VRHETWFLFGVLGLASVSGCGGSEKEVRSESAHQRVKAKSGVVWRNDIARGLELDPSEVCVELGLYDCIDDAHRITMGGMEPERLGIDEPLDEPPASAPIAFDRAAIGACSRRFIADRTGSPVVFGPVLDADTPANREAVVTALVQRLLSRDPTDDQRRELAALHDTLAPLSSDVVADWSIGACLIVATSTEALFY
jgi:hypothetical protein